MSIAATFLHVPCSAIITNAAGLNVVTYESQKTGDGFDIDATLIVKTTESAIFQDETGASYASIYETKLCQMPGSSGDKIRILGTVIYDTRFQQASAVCTNLIIKSKGKAVQPIETTVPELLTGKYDFRPAKFTGTLRNIAFDVIDARYAFLLVDSGGKTIPVALSSEIAPISYDKLPPVGATVEVTGICHYGANSARHLTGRIVSASTDLKIITPEPADPFDVPDLKLLRNRQPADFATLGRRRITGTVLCTYSGRRFLLQDNNLRTYTIHVAKDPLPSNGDCVTVVGYPETDIYNFHLTYALWKRRNAPPTPPEAATPISVRELFREHTGQAGINPDFHGKAITLVGTIQDIRPGKLQLNSEGELVEVDLTAFPHALPKIQLGSIVQVSGICIMDIERWHPNDIFPIIRGFSIVVRTPEDIDIVAQPPWWTPQRLFATIGILFAALLAFFVWNIALHKLSEQRGRKLAKEQVARLQSDLKAYERTRLAVELHDSIAQSLTGAAMEINAAHRFADSNVSAMKNHLTIAAKTIDSCRRDVRNCIWDLRSNALEEKDPNVAIRKVLEPHLSNTRLVMRFNIPRSRLSDNTLHAFIRIIRELTVNAIRHGRAKTVWVAGSIEDDMLMFSVRDDGCGFDPENCPGMEDGHFGIEGIRERIKQFGGSLNFTRLAGRGMKATIFIKLTKIT